MKKFFLILSAVALVLLLASCGGSSKVDNDNSGDGSDSGSGGADTDSGSTGGNGDSGSTGDNTDSGSTGDSTDTGSTGDNTDTGSTGDTDSDDKKDDDTKNDNSDPRDGAEVTYIHLNAVVVLNRYNLILNLSINLLDKHCLPYLILIGLGDVFT